MQDLLLKLCAPTLTHRWCTLSTYPVFTYGTITYDIFLNLLKDEFVPSLQGYGTAINSVWIQHDSTPAKPYFSFFVFSREVETCRNGTLRSLRRDYHGHELTLVTFLWSHLNNRMFKKSTQNLETKLFSIPTLAKVPSNNVVRLRKISMVQTIKRITL
jgi:hypothetical protein